MKRALLPPENIAPEALALLASYHRELVDEVAAAVAANRVVVIGMAQNPFVKKVRRLLEDAAIDFTYLEYGSYFALWKPRLAIKMWSGWPTFPQVFVDGMLIGGFSEADAALKAGRIPAQR
jgi:glutaredoxin-related protein